MDDIVRQAMAKWPNVPDCYGWLGLDARGRWYLRDAEVQARGPFAGGDAAARGTLLEHERLLAFIGRNYASDERGCWFFQNGPQRVYVELEVAPWIWRIADDLTLSAHTGAPAQWRSGLLDDEGRVFLETDLGVGLVHSLDVERVADGMERQGWQLQPVVSAQLPDLYRFVLRPQQLAAGAA